MTESLNVITAFVVLFAVFYMLERLFSYHHQAVFRKQWFTDLLFFAGQYLVWGAVIGFLLGLLHVMFSPLTMILSPWFQQQVFWLQILEVVLLGDLLVYWGHRMSHRIDFLWRFHRVHHTAEKLDWLAAHREHPADGLYTQTLANLPAIILGFPVVAIIGLVAFRGIWAIFIHSNARIPTGPLKWILGSPELHHWHHDKEKNSSVNFANLNPLMDKLFGTYYLPDRDPVEYGIKDDVPHDYIGQLIYPFKIMLYRKSGNTARENINPHPSRVCRKSVVPENQQTHEPVVTGNVSVDRPHRP